MLENLCADGMPCKPAQVRALERAAFCANASILARHGEYVPAGGPKCLP